MEKKLELKHEIRVTDGETTSDEYVLTQSYTSTGTFGYSNIMTLTKKDLIKIKEMIEEKLIRS